MATPIQRVTMIPCTKLMTILIPVNHDLSSCLHLLLQLLLHQHLTRVTRAAAAAVADKMIKSTGRQQHLHQLQARLQQGCRGLIVEVIVFTMIHQHLLHPLTWMMRRAMIWNSDPLASKSLSTRLLKARVRVLSLFFSLSFRGLSFD